MAVEQTQVGPLGPTQNGGYNNFTSNPYGDQIVAHGAPQYFEWVRNGYVFTCVTTTAVSLGTIGVATTMPILWNRISQNKIVVPLVLNVLPYVATASTVGPMYDIGIGYLTSPGDVVNASYISAFVQQTPVSNILGRTKYAPSTYWSPAGTIGSAGIGNKWFTTGQGFFSQLTIATTTSGFFGHSYDFRGLVVMAPGSAICLGANTASPSTLTYNFSLIYAELPMPAGF